MPRGAGINLSPTSAELRDVAARARRHARALAGDEAERQLLELADELEARATAMEEPRPVTSP
jgi:hypothetical protein